MRLELYISDTRLDINDGTTVPISLKYFELNDITNRFSNFSQKFKLPRTKNNEVTLGVLGNEKSTSSIPYQKNNARLFVDGIQYFPDAYMIVQKLSTTFVECQLFSGVYDFFQRVSGKKLKDLDLSAYNRAWNKSDQNARRNATSGLVAAVINYGSLDYDTYDNTNPEIPAMHNPPSIYFNDLIQQIFTDVSLTPSGDIFSETKYLQTIIPFSKDKWNPFEDFKKQRSPIVLIASTQSESSPSDVKIEFDDFEFEGSESYYSTTNHRLEVDGGTYTTDKFICYNLKATIDVSVSGGDVEIYVWKTTRGIIVGSSVTLEDGYADTLEYNFYDETKGNLASPYLLDCKDGDVIEIRVNTLNGTPSVDFTAGRIQFIAEMVFNHTDLVLDISNDVMNQTVKQIDLIKAFIIMNGLIAKQEQSTVIFKSFDDIINNKANAVDWTSKRDYSKNETIKYSFGNLSQVNNFKYLSNDDYTFEDNGKGSIDISNSLLKSETDYYTSIFNSSGEEDFFLMSDIIAVPVFTRKTESNALEDRIFPSSFNFENSQSPGMRIAIARDKKSFEPTVDLYNLIPGVDATAMTSYKAAYFNDSGETLSLDFQDFINDNYSLILDSLSKSKLVTRYYLLSSEDIVTFDPHKPVYDDGSYFIVNEIKNFIPDQPTQVELLKIV